MTPGKQPKVSGRVRESADGLRKRDQEASKRQLRETQRRVGREAARQRQDGHRHDH